jgi:hypothetical protein
VSWHTTRQKQRKIGSPAVAQVIGERRRTCPDGIFAGGQLARNYVRNIDIVSLLKSHHLYDCDVARHRRLMSRDVAGMGQVSVVNQPATVPNACGATMAAWSEWRDRRADA